MAEGSTLRLQQLLAQLGYLPVSFTPAGPLPAPQEAAQPQQGSFGWRWNEPAPLVSQWTVGTPNVITTGAVMTFESRHNMKTDGLAGPAVWQQLLTDAIAGTMDSAPYNYVYVTKSLPETATVYSNGSRSTPPWPIPGWPAAPTASGTYPGLRPLPGHHHDRHQSRRIALLRPGHPLGQLLQRRGRPARLRPRQLRLPPERRVRGDAAGQRRRGLPLTPIGTLVTVS